MRGSDTGREPRIFTGIAHSLRTKWQGGPAMTRQTPSNTRGNSAISDDRSASFCASDSWEVGVDETRFTRAWRYLVWSILNFLCVSEQRTACCRSSRTWRVVTRAGSAVVSSADQSIVAENDPNNRMALPIAVRVVTTGCRWISGEKWFVDRLRNSV